MNTDNGSPMVRIGSVENDLGGDFHLQKGKVFQGGGFQHLHKMLDIQSGSEVLYVGDVSCASSLSLSPMYLYTSRNIQLAANDSKGNGECDVACRSISTETF